MKEKPLITIGVTCFNCEKTIERALKSAINQDWPNKQIILIDDKSTDNSKIVLSKLKSLYPSIKLILNTQNKGLAHNENLIIKNAKGEFIAFFDGDDESEPNRISKQYERFIEYEIRHSDSKIFVYSNRNIVPLQRNEKKLIKFGIGNKSPEPYGKIVAEYILNIKNKSDNFNWGVFGSGTMFTKTACLKDLKGFDEDFKRGAELDLWVRASLKGFHFISVNESLMTQYITYGNHKSLNKDLSSRIQLVKKHKKFFIKKLLYISSYLNFYAWYWYTKRIKFLGHIFRFFSKCFMTINKIKKS